MSHLFHRSGMSASRFATPTIYEGRCVACKGTGYGLPGALDHVTCRCQRPYLDRLTALVGQTVTLRIGDAEVRGTLAVLTSPRRLLIEIDGDPHQFRAPVFELGDGLRFRDMDFADCEVIA